MPLFGRRRPGRARTQPVPAGVALALERRELDPRSASVLGAISEHYDVMAIGDGGWRFRVFVEGAGSGRDAAIHLAALLDEIDPEWEDLVTWPTPLYPER